MKSKKLSLLIFGMLLISGGIASFAVAAEASCDLQSLKGSYDFIASGKMIPMMGAESGNLEVDTYELRTLRVTGTIYADGAGNASVQKTEVPEGFSPVESKFNGTYTVNPDCTGKISFLPNDNESAVTGGYDFVIKKSGKLRFVSSVDHTLIAGRAWRTSDAGASIAAYRMVYCPDPYDQCDPGYAYVGFNRCQKCQ